MTVGTTCRMGSLPAVGQILKQSPVPLPCLSGCSVSRFRSKARLVTGIICGVPKNAPSLELGIGRVELANFRLRSLNLIAQYNQVRPVRVVEGLIEPVRQSAERWIEKFSIAHI